MKFDFIIMENQTINVVHRVSQAETTLEENLKSQFDDVQKKVKEVK